MKRILDTLCILALLLFTAAVAAQVMVPLPDAHEAIVIDFYDGNPFDGGKLIETDFTVLLRDRSSRKLEGENADYLLLNLAGTKLAFETWGVTGTSSTHLKNINGGEYVVLSEVVRGIYNALRAEKELAIFTDADGVVTGFYSYHKGVDTLVDAPDTESLMHFVEETCTLYDASNTTSTRLANVTVQVAGKSMSLGQAVVRN